MVKRMITKEALRRFSSVTLDKYLWAYCLVSGGLTWFTMLSIYIHKAVRYTEPNVPWLTCEVIIASIGFALVIIRCAQNFLKKDLTEPGKMK